MDLNEDDKLKILLIQMESHRKSIDYRRDQQFKAFSWISTIYIAVMAGIISLITKSEQGNFEINILVPLLITIGAVFLGIAYLFFLIKCKNSMNRNAINIVSIEKELKMFEKNFYISDKTLYSEKSKNWGKKINSASPETNFYLTAVIILFILIVTLAWLLM